MKNRTIDKTYYDESPYYDQQIKGARQVVLGSLPKRGTASSHSASPPDWRHQRLGIYQALIDRAGYFQKYRISKVLQIYTPSKNERVLDLGCGLGTFCFAVAPFCQDVTGLDYSRKSINLCNQLLTLTPYQNINLICADAQETPFVSESYDVIICADLVEHLYPQDFEDVLVECRRLLKPSGKLVIWAPHRGHLLEHLKNRNILLKRDVTHVHYKSMPYLLDNLRQSHFSIQKSYYAESHLPLFRHLEQWLLPFIPLMRRRIAILAEKKL